MESELHRKLLSIFSEVFQIDIDPTTEDVERRQVEVWDSINHLRLVAEIEEVFGIMLSDDEVTTLISLRGVERLLLKRESSMRSR